MSICLKPGGLVCPHDFEHQIGCPDGDGMSTSCVLEDDHDGDCHFVRDDKITFTLTNKPHTIVKEN